MALLYTPKISPGQNQLAKFELSTVEGKIWNSEQILPAPAKVIVFMCNHCPYVKAIESRLIELARDLKVKNVPFIGICSNDATDYPEDSPTELLKTWKTKNYNFPYLIDDSQEVAKRLGAVCTPDFFVYDKNNLLRYRGRLDDSWKDVTKVTRRELKDAVDNLIENNTLSHEQVPSMGCSIKWKK